MDDLGKSFSDLPQEEIERREKRDQLIAEIDVLDAPASEGWSEETEANEDTAENKKIKLYETYTDEERIARLREFLYIYKEMSDEGYPITIEVIMGPWGHIPEDRSPELEAGLIKIKEENPWIMDFEEEEE